MKALTKNLICFMIFFFVGMMKISQYTTSVSENTINGLNKEDIFE